MSHSPKFAARPVGRVRLSLRRSRLLAVLALAVVALTGCVTVQLDATVHPDGTLSGTARFGVVKSLASAAGGEDALRQRLKSEDGCDFGNSKSVTKNFDDGTYIGIECTFDNITMADFNSGEDGPKLAKNGNQFQLTGNLDLLNLLNSSSGGLLGGSTSSTSASSAAPLPTDLGSLLPSDLPTDLSSLLSSDLPTDLGSFLPSNLPSDLSSLLPSELASQLNSQLASGLPSTLPSTLPSDLSSLLPTGASGLPSLDPQALLKQAKVQFAFTFPGKVSSSKGSVSGNKVTFKPDSSGKIDFTTVASATPSSSNSGTKIWLPVAIVVILALLVAAFLIRRPRSGGPGEPALAGGYPQPGPGQPGYGQAAYDQPGYGRPGYDPQQQFGQPGPSGYQPTQEFPAQPPYHPPHPDQPPSSTRPYEPPQPYQPPQSYEPPQPYQPPASNQPPPEQGQSSAPPPDSPWQAPPGSDRPPGENPDDSAGGNRP